MDGVEATTQIKKDLPHIKVVMLTSFIEDKEVYPLKLNQDLTYVLFQLPLFLMILPLLLQYQIE
jgi:CheY-like chemotaxis protein